MFRTIKQLRFNNIITCFIKQQQSKMSTIEELKIVENNELHENNKRPLEDSNVDDVEAKIQKVERVKKKNFAIMLGYLGKDYFGMQRNPKMRTIEEDLIGAMFQAKLIDQESFETIQYTHFQRAARTDKGVSATRQICSVKLPEQAKMEDINQYLPPQIRVFGLKRVTKGFNSKSQCNARTYTYTLPTFAFAPDNPNIISTIRPPTDEEIEKRLNDLQTIDGKSFTDFRMTPELLEKVNATLKLFEGTHNFHNFTSKVRPFDPRAQRFMIKCHCLEVHTSNNVEYATILIKGQSFMLHQIRKMVALAIAVIRNVMPEEIIEDCFNPEKKDIPIAPSLGLVLNHVHYDNYNKRFGSDGLHEKLEWDDCEEEVQKFHKEFILRHIEETEVSERSMLLWLADLPRHTFADRTDRKDDDEADDDIETSEAADA